MKPNILSLKLFKTKSLVDTIKKHHKFYFYFFLFIINLGCGSKDVVNSDYNPRYITNDSLLSIYYSDYRIDSLKRYNPISLKDSIQFPHLFSIEFFVIDIIDYQTNKNDFILKTLLSFENNKESLIIENDTIETFNPDEWLSIDYEGSSEDGNNVIGDLEYNGEYYFENLKDSIHSWTRYFETKKYHNWKMTNYPFDIQKIKFEIISDFDTSYVRLQESKNFKASFEENISLPEGFKISSIDFKEKFKKSSYQMKNEFGEDFNPIQSVAEFTINIRRDGLSLFLKLFFGSFLSLILSISAFYIPREEFDAKSQIAVGAIFAAVGNKYFVDSNTFSNVMTIADVINNFVIILVILNVFIMIAQRNPIINWYWLEKDKNAVKLSIISMILLGLSITILYM